MAGKGGVLRAQSVSRADCGACRLCSCHTCAGAFGPAAVSPGLGTLDSGCRCGSRPDSTLARQGKARPTGRHVGMEVVSMSAGALEWPMDWGPPTELAQPAQAPQGWRKPLAAPYSASALRGLVYFAHPSFTLQAQNLPDP